MVVTEVNSDDKAAVQPLNFKYVVTRWQLEGTHGIDKRIHYPVKALEAAAKWLAKIPYQYWISIFSETKRKNPFNLPPKSNGMKSMTTTVRIRRPVSRMCMPCFYVK